MQLFTVEQFKTYGDTRWGWTPDAQRRGDRGPLPDTSIATAILEAIAAAGHSRDVSQGL